MHFTCLVSLYTLILMAGTSASCPAHCVCKWKNGKQTVECVNKSMITVPAGIDSGTQVFDFSGNDVEKLGSEQFQRLGLVHLQRIFLSRCRVAAVDDRAFQALSNLIELDLSNNRLTGVPVEVFADLPSLMKLNLNGNPLRTLHAYSFKNLKYLVSLELSRCELAAIEADAFYGLSALELLKLDHNSLRYIPGADTIPRKLHGVQLQPNPWFCDCRLADLYAWLNRSTLMQATEPRCEGPARLHNAPIKQLDELELACLPDVSPTSLYLEIGEGKNVSLTCRVNAQPEARISWRFQDRLLQNDSTVAPGVHLYYYVEEGTVEKRSELFIFNTNAEDNGTFICVAENQAGRAQSNYTIRIVLREEPMLRDRRVLPAEYVMGVCALAATLVAFFCTCLISCWLRRRVLRRKQRRKKQKSKDSAALYGDSTTAGGAASPITRSGETLSTISEASAHKAMNGNIFIADSHCLLKMNGGGTLVEAAAATTAAAAAASNNVSHIFYPCSAYMPEPNPDLINDTGVDGRRLSGGVKLDAAALSPAANDGLVCDPTYASISTGGEPRSWTPINVPCSEGVRAVPLNVCFSHFQTSGQEAPQHAYAGAGDFRLPKVATHFPSVLPATAFYRTLPHKRHTTSNATAGGASTRFARDAELLTRSLHPAPYEHFHSSDVRSNVEGYPKKDSPAFTYASNAAAAATPHVSFSDTVQILGVEAPLLPPPPPPSRNNERQIQVALISDELAKKCGVEATTATTTMTMTNNEAKSKVAKLSIKVKSKTDSPDEGYVGECADTTEV